jgi:hypothetical protein
MIDLPAGFKLVSRAASGGGQSDGLANRVEWQESRGNQGAVSPRGAFGVMQLMPDTARDPGFGVAPLDPNAPDPEVENRRVGRDYLNAMLERYGGDQEAALAAYNWGPGRADRWVASGKGRGRLPRETQGYLNNILGDDEQATVASASQPYRLSEPIGEEQPAQPMAAPQQPAQGGIPLPPGFKKVGAPRPPAEPALQTPPLPADGGITESMADPATMPPEKPLPKELSWGETADDVMRNYLSKTVGMGVGLAGLPGDIVKGAEWAEEKIGWGKKDDYSASIPGSAEIDKVVRDKLGNYDYEPQTWSAKAAGAVPLVVGVGKGLRGVKQAGGIVAGATAGKELGGTPGEIVGMLAGGKAGGGRLPKVNPERGAREAYKAAENVSIDGSDFHNFSQNLAKDSVVRKALLNPTLYPKLNAIVGDIASHVPSPPAANPMAKPGFLGAGGQAKWNPGEVAFEDFDNMRQNLVRVLMRSNDKGERRIANHIISRLDGYFDNAKLTPGSGMTAAQAGAKAKEARQLWKQHRKSQEIETILEVAKDDAGRFSISGHENAIRTGFRQLSKRITRYPSVAGKYTDEEKALIHKLSRGGKVRNMMQWVSKLTPNAITAPMGLGYGATTGDWQGAAGMAAAGVGGRVLGGMGAKRQAEQLRRLTAAGGAKLPGGRAMVPLGVSSATLPYRNDDQ